MIPTFTLAGFGHAEAAGGGGGGGSSHRYWRIYIHTNNGGARCTILDMQYRATLGGSTLTGSGTASASSEANGSNTAAMAFDGTVNKWTSVLSVGDEWVAYDFGSPVFVAQVAIYGAENGQEAFAPQDFDIQWSDDGSSWTTALVVTGQTLWAYLVIRTFDL